MDYFISKCNFVQIFSSVFFGFLKVCELSSTGKAFHAFKLIIAAYAG